MSSKAASKPAKRGPSPAVKAYLVAYNLACTIGWAYVCCTTYSSLIFGVNGSIPSPTELFQKISPTLQIVQTMALLEVVHAAIGIVPSAVFTTFVQVMSRIIVLWGYTVPVSHSHWSLYLLVASWSTVEIPRYLFYVWQLLFPEVAAPYPLFFLRYSLFAVLYPTGISGEIIQLWQSLSYYRKTFPIVRLLSYAVLFILYPPGSPFMYMHMVKMRKTQFKKRKDAEDAAKGVKPVVKPQEGLIFPVDPATGVASTSDLGKKSLAAATAVASKAAAEAVLAEKNWRFKYGPHFVKHVELAAKSPKNAVEMAKAGLEFCYDNFQFVRGDFTGSLRQALAHFQGSFLEGKVVGKGTKKSEVTVQYQGAELTGAALEAQLDKWVKYGTIEPSCKDAIMWANKNKLDLADKYFVLLGAGAAMGPLKLLLALGANIIALDLDRPQIWQRILGEVEKSASTVIFPMKAQPKDNSVNALAEVAGCNLFTQTPEAANFVAAAVPDATLVIGSYAYLDSAAHVQVSLAMDAVVRTAIEKRGNDKVKLAYLCSPTDVFTEDEATYKAAVANRAASPLWQKLLAGRPLKSNGIATKDDQGKDVYINDGIVTDQGPNYAWAKRIQHWRAVLEFTKGSTVATNIAPSTATLSVIHNASFKAAYGGMALFKPMEVMMPELSNSAMCALMLHDVCNDNSPKNPRSTAGAAIAKSNPMMLFASGALHGGVWRLGYKMDTIGVVAAVAFYAKTHWYVPAGLLAAIASVAGGAIQLP